MLNARMLKSNLKSFINKVAMLTGMYF